MVKLSRVLQLMGFPGGAVVKNPPANAGNIGPTINYTQIKTPAVQVFTIVTFIFLSYLATHSSILAWKIPWTEEPGRLQSMGSLKFRHDRAT